MQVRRPVQRGQWRLESGTSARRKKSNRDKKQWDRKACQRVWERSEQALGKRSEYLE